MAKINKLRNIPEVDCNNIFVGREDLINRYWNDFNSNSAESSEWTLSVINYYGMSGIGKTELANHLYNQHIDKGIKAVSFTFLETQSFISNILDFKKCIQDNLNIRFPMFDMAYMAYYKRSGRALDINYFKTILDNDVVEAIYPLLNVMPKINIVAAIVQSLKPLENKLRKLFSEEELYFVRESSDMIFSKLSYYFISDLHNALQYEKDTIAVFIDNAEPFVGVEFEEWFLAKSGAVRNLPNIVWCILSQCPITDTLVEKDKIIQSIEIMPLNYYDMVSYLNKKGVETGYIDSIIGVSEGIPVYLSIIVELYFEHIKTKSLSDFNLEDGKDRLLKNYFYFLDEESKTVLKVLSFLETWTSDIAINLLSELGIRVDAYEKIIRHTYIKRCRNRLYIHSVVADAIKNEITDSLYLQLGNKIRWIKTDKSDRLFLALLEAQIAIYRAKDSELNEVIFNLYSLFEKIKNNVDYDYMYKLHRMIVSRVAISKEPILAESLPYYMYSKLYIDTGFSLLALDYIHVAYKIVCSCTRPITMKEKDYWGYCSQIKEEYAQALFKNNRFEESLGIRKAIMSEAPFWFGKNH